MAVDERRRHHLYDHCRETWDEEAAETLMALLPPVGWADVATKQDLASLATEMRGEIAGLRADLGGEISGLRADLGSEISGLRADLGGEIKDLRAEFHALLRTQTWRVLGAILAGISTSAAVGAAIASLG